MGGSPSNRSTAAGIGYAIPWTIARDVADQLLRRGRAVDRQRAAIGALVATLTRTDGHHAGVGILQTHPAGPARRAGLVAGDVITSVNGRSTTNAETLAAVLAGLRIGQTAPMRVTHTDGTSATVGVTLGKLPVRQ
ncbi:MAG: S1C family serine protease [Frankia sp.]